MRALPLLLGFAFTDLLLVATGRLAPASGLDSSLLRAQLLGTIVVTGAGAVALLALALARRFAQACGDRAIRRELPWMLVVLRGLVALGFAAWTYLWLTPAHYPVGMACGACVLMLLWQGVGEAKA